MKEAAVNSAAAVAENEARDVAEREAKVVADRVAREVTRTHIKVADPEQNVNDGPEYDPGVDMKMPEFLRRPRHSPEG